MEKQTAMKIVEVMAVAISPCRTEGGGLMDSFFAWLIGLWATGAWLTHVIVCLQGAKWGFLIAGALMFPIAIVHGTGIWFGAW